jgi:uncharacterized protein YdgA (DUF945 family)
LQRKNIVIAVSVAAVLAAGYLAPSWFLGRQIEAAHRRVDAQIAALPFLKLIRHDYERGVFTADETIVIEIPALTVTAAPEPAESGEAGQEVSPVSPRVTLKNLIRHGPLLDSGFAAGSATTFIEFDEAIQKKVLEAFGGKPPMESLTLYDFSGGGRSTLTSPAFRIAVPGKNGDQATLSGSGLEMTVEFTQGLAQYSLRGGAPGFELATPDGLRLTLTGFGIEARQQRLFPDEPWFYTGLLQFLLAGLEIDPGQSRDLEKQPRIALKDLKYDMNVSAAGEFIDVIVSTGVAGLRIGEQDYGPAVHDSSLKHLHARKLAAINREIKAPYMEPETPQNEERLLPAVASMKDKLVALLLDDPVLSIDRLAFRLPEGEAELSASFKLAGAEAGDFDSPLNLVKRLDATAGLAVPVISARTLLANVNAKNEEEAQKRGEAVDRILDAFVRQGYATIDNGILKSRLVFRELQLLVNDRPFNPMTFLGLGRQTPPGR